MLMECSGLYRDNDMQRSGLYRDNDMQIYDK